jgi:hypothetical protein
MVTDPITSCSSEDVVLATVYGTPVVGLTNDTAVCLGTTVNLTATGGTSYQWSSGQTTSSISVTPTSTTQFIVTVSDGICATSDTVNVMVNDPNLDLGQDLAMFSSQSIVLDAGPGYTSYLWTTGATTQTIVVDTSLFGIGTFNIGVTIMDSIGCTASDNVNISFISVGMEENETAVSVSLQPNPTDGKFEIHIQGVSSKIIHMEVMNLTGQVVYSQSLDHSPGKKHAFDLGLLPSGVYMVRIQSAEGIHIRKLILN